MASWRNIADWAKRRPITLRLADRLGRGRGRLRWIDRIAHLPRPSVVPTFDGWDDHSLAAAWIGHATVLLRMEGMTILTDPVFSPKVGLGFGFLTGGPRRLVAPAIAISALPRIDLVLLSHAHFDHLDLPTLHRLDRRIPVVTAHRTEDLVRELGFGDVTELRWGEQHTIGPLRITARRVVHWGARTFYDSHRGFNGYLLETPRRRVLFGGDTAYHEAFRDLRPVNLAILGIGAYDPYIQAHATPEQALAMADHAHAERVLPMHHSTFRLSYEPMNEPIERILDAAGDPARIVIQRIGEQWRL